MLLPFLEVVLRDFGRDGSEQHDVFDTVRETLEGFLDAIIGAATSHLTLA